MATWVVTGTNRGIGLEICRQLKERGEDVVAACRARSGKFSGNLWRFEPKASAAAGTCPARAPRVDGDMAHLGEGVRAPVPWSA